ncbi:MAG TPA: TonB-dependent receptor, partial [Sphingomicrobium sp.]
MRFFPLLLLATPISAAAFAQAGTPPAPVDPAIEADEIGEDIIVTGGRERGSVVGDIKPEVVLRGADIRAYGASDLGELLEALGPLTGSNQGGGGPPVTLLDGRRISNFREIRDLPPEAVVRVDILPEEVALKYGYRSDQKVVNFVLRPRFRATTAEASVRAATGGGRQTDEIDVNHLRLRQGTRLSLDGEYTRSTPLFESERNLVAPDPDRTLLSASDALKLNGTYNRMILGNVSATLNGEFVGQDTRGSLGRSASGEDRLFRDSRNRSGAIGYALNGGLGEWHWSLDGGYTLDRTRTLTDRQAGRAAGRDLARVTVQALNTTA